MLSGGFLFLTTKELFLKKRFFRTVYSPKESGMPIRKRAACVKLNAAADSGSCPEFRSLSFLNEAFPVPSGYTALRHFIRSLDSSFSQAPNHSISPGKWRHMDRLQPLRESTPPQMQPSPALSKATRSVGVRASRFPQVKSPEIAPRWKNHAQSKTASRKRDAAGLSEFVRNQKTAGEGAPRFSMPELPDAGTRQARRAGARSPCAGCVTFTGSHLLACHPDQGSAFAIAAISPTPLKTMLGRYAYLFSVSRVETPESTRTVVIPLSIPEITSVSIRSPTITASAE